MRGGSEIGISGGTAAKASATACSAERDRRLIRVYLLPIGVSQCAGNSSLHLAAIGAMVAAAEPSKSLMESVAYGDTASKQAVT